MKIIDITEYAKRHLTVEDIEALESMIGCEVTIDGKMVNTPDGEKTHIDFLKLK